MYIQNEPEIEQEQEPEIEQEQTLTSQKLIETINNSIKQNVFIMPNITESKYENYNKINKKDLSLHIIIQFECNSIIKEEIYIPIFSVSGFKYTLNMVNTIIQLTPNLKFDKFEEQSNEQNNSIIFILHYNQDNIDDDYIKIKNIIQNNFYSLIIFDNDYIYSIQTCDKQLITDEKLNSYSIDEILTEDYNNKYIGNYEIYTISNFEK